MTLREITREELAEALQTQVCPWCGQGPFKILAIHTFLKHGLSAHDLRDILGLPTQASICAKDYSQFRRELPHHNPPTREIGGKYPYSQRGLTRIRNANASRMPELGQFLASMSPERRSEAGKRGAASLRARRASDPEFDRTIRQKMGDSKRGRFKIPRDEQAVIRAKHIEGKTAVALAREYGVHRETIGRIVRAV